MKIIVKSQYSKSLIAFNNNFGRVYQQKIEQNAEIKEICKRHIFLASLKSISPSKVYKKTKLILFFEKGFKLEMCENTL